jgi:excinuclease ABC subunit C
MDQIPFNPADPRAALAQLPHSPAVFALYGADAHAEPYIGRTPNLQSRLARLLLPSEKHPRRLQLASRVRRIAYRLTGSEFESLLAQFSLIEEAYGARACERMHLRMPAFVRFLGGNPYPRMVVTNRPSLREAEWSYGPFPSRAAAERYAEEALKLFLLRRCTDDLNPDPSHPGCIYSEMKMCLAPCYKGCTDARYAEEAAAVQNFFATRGESRLITLRAEREAASADLEFESASAIHAQVQRVETVRALASELVRPLNKLCAVILQAAAQPGEVSVFLFADGLLRGPVPFSTLGMRIQNEQSGSSSLFAQPLALEPVPEEQGAGNGEQGTGNRNRGSGIRDQGTEDEGTRGQGSEGPRDQAAEGPSDRPDATVALRGHDFSRAVTDPKKEGALAPEGDPRPHVIPRNLLESRLESVLASLATPAGAPSAAIRQGHLALLKRWYYRPEAKRTGEIFFPDDNGHWPHKAILRGIGRVAAKMLAPSGPT